MIWRLGFLIAAALGLLVATVSPPEVSASGCSYHYGNSYGYGGSYGGSGSSYWSGGYWPGGSGYAAGNYKSGYYPSYNYNTYEQPYFVRYKAVIPLIEIPSYGAFVVDPPPSPATPATAPTTGTHPVNPAAGSDIVNKLDQILVMAKRTSDDVNSLRVRVEVLEGRRQSNTPHPDVTPPAKAALTAEQGPSVMHGRCASCHDSKAVAKERAKVTLFADGPGGPEMAGVNSKGELEPLSTATLKKVERVLVDGTMPPEKNVSGAKVAAMTQDERKAALEFVRKVLSGGGK